MMSSETHLEEEVGVVDDVYGWLNLHNMSMCLAAAYFIYYLLIIVRVRHKALCRFLSIFFTPRRYVAHYKCV